MAKSKRTKFEEGQAQPPATASDMPQSDIARPPAVEARSLDPEQIARRAYELYLARGGEHGRSEEDWFTAERELSVGSRPGPQS
jgi:hypothetical protein